jgi:hypothetical protein
VLKPPVRWSRVSWLGLDRLRDLGSKCMPDAAAEVIESSLRRISAARTRILAGVIAGVFVVGGCSKHPPLAEPAVPLTPPTRLCSARETPPACRSAAQVEESMSGQTELLGVAPTPGGTQGAKILTLQVKVGRRSIVFREKWRPQSSADIINEPRKELAAYAVQKLFLDETELVVPPTVAHCFPLTEYRNFVPDEQPTFDGTDCVFGFASYWLESVKTAGSARDGGLLGAGEGAWDPDLFESDRLYRRSVSNTNLLTYLINHGDAHNAQFLLEQTPGGVRAYVVDNSIAFRSIHNPMLLFREDWSKVRVPLLPRRTVERLRALTDEDFARLAIVAELERRGKQLVSVAPTPVASESDGKAMAWAGDHLRIGLTPGEIELVRSRVRDLLARPDLESIVDR